MIKENDFREAANIVEWKDNIRQHWKQIVVDKLIYPDTSKSPLQLGDSFDVEVWLKNIEGFEKDIKVEFVTAKKEGERIKEFLNNHPLELVSVEGNMAKYSGHVIISRAGVINFAFRVYPWNEKLPHRQDFPLVEWV
jgi:hypothetical protein